MDSAHGAAWRDLPEHYGPWRSVASRFYRWRESGVWDRVLSALQVQANAEGRLDWEVHLVDATIVRAHQHAAGAKKSAGESAEGRAAVEALGYRGYLRQRGMRITTPRKRNECRSGPFNWAVYRMRNRIERLINRCKQFRRLATRYEKRAVNYRAMWLIAVCLLWL